MDYGSGMQIRLHERCILSLAWANGQGLKYLHVQRQFAIDGEV
jgi:hypothetical protein